MSFLPKRKDIRLSHHGYDANGAYFLTICAKDRKPVFWTVGATFGRPSCRGVDECALCGYPSIRMPAGCALSAAGALVASEIERIDSHFAGATELFSYVVMPDHIHLLLALNAGGEGGRPKVAPTISRVVQQFKGAVSKRLGVSLWQKGFYDHVVRGEQDMAELREYINNNPRRWQIKREPTDREAGT